MSSIYSVPFGIPYGLIAGVGLHKVSYESGLHGNGAILTLPATLFVKYTSIAVEASFTAREVSSAKCAFFRRVASFQNEGNSLVQVGSTRTVAVDDDSGVVSTYGGAVSIGLTTNQIVYSVSSSSGTIDWSVFTNLMIYGIST